MHAVFPTPCGDLTPSPALFFQYFMQALAKGMPFAHLISEVCKQYNTGTAGWLDSTVPADVYDYHPRKRSASIIKPDRIAILCYFKISRHCNIG
jgi:hypothetical protein